MIYKSAIVAGGAGFVGSHLCRRLLRDGYAVTCIDDLSTGCMDNISSLMENTQFRFMEQDITSLTDMPDAVDEIYNLACPASPVQYQKNPIQTFRTNVIGSMNLLELACRKHARILLASTSEVYGDPTVHPQREDYWGNVNVNGVRSCYDEGKRGAETLFHDYNNMYGTDTRIIRIFNTYGPHMNMEDGRVVSNFIVQALKGEPLTIYGDGSQTRSFQYIDDLIEAIVQMMQDKITHNPVNIGNPNEITVRELADIVIRITGSQSQISYKNLPQDDPCHRKPDISFAMRELNGWLPKVGLEEGLAKTVVYFHGVIDK